MIPRALLADPEVFRAEQEHLFTKVWTFFGHESEMDHPGRYTSAIIAGRPIVVVRNRDGELKGFYNSCAHRGAVLAPDRVGDCGGAFQCMYHGWTYDLNGALHHVPEPEGMPADFDRSKNGLRPVRVETYAGLVFVNLDVDAAPLAEWIGPEFGELLESRFGGMEVIGRNRYRIKANWKLMRENGGDGYHAPYAHPHVAMLATLDALRHENHLNTFPNGHCEVQVHVTFDGFDPERFMSGVEKITGLPSDGEEFFEANMFPPDPVDATQPNTVTSFFPNGVLFSNWGGSDSHIEAVYPVSHDRSFVENIVFGKPGESEAMRKHRLDVALLDIGTSGRAGADDLEAWARCQTGSDSYEDIPYSNIERGLTEGWESNASDDVAIRRFYDTYLELMGDNLPKSVVLAEDQR